MRIAFFLLSLLVVSALASSKDAAPVKKENIAEVARSWFTTFTLIIASSTTTTTSTSITTCTTSSTTLTTCTNGRRRRGLFVDDSQIGRARRGLFYSEDEAQKEDYIYTPSVEKR